MFDVNDVQLVRCLSAFAVTSKAKSCKTEGYAKLTGTELTSSTSVFQGDDMLVGHGLEDYVEVLHQVLLDFFWCISVTMVTRFQMIATVLQIGCEVLVDFHAENYVQISAIV